MTKKLASAGLIPKKEVATLGKFLEAYIQGRTELNDSTKLNLSIVQGTLVAYFGAERTLTSISAGEADEFRRHLLSTLKENTVRKRCSIPKQFFNAAFRKRLITQNPFSDIKGSVTVSKARDYFVTREAASKVLETCPSAQWRLIF